MSLLIGAGERHRHSTVDDLRPGKGQSIEGKKRADRQGAAAELLIQCGGWKAPDPEPVAIEGIVIARTEGE